MGAKLSIDINKLKSSTEAAKKDLLLQSQEFVKAVTIDAWRFITANSLSVGIQFGSPVLTGQYYTNHRIRVNGIDTSVTYLANPDPDKPVAGLPLTKAVLELTKFKLGDSITISNSLPYAQRLEEGWSKFKAPEGIYQIAVDRINVKYGKGLKL